MGAAGRGMTLSPLHSMRELSHVTEREQAARFARSWPAPPRSAPEPPSADNPLRRYFDGVEQGPGIWKWLHYFDLYHQHLQKFVGKQLNIVEVGVYSGGSMPMWRNYFGDGCQVHGVDIQAECRAYENDHIQIHIGDQADRSFWRKFRADVPEVDVLIDDGGHQPYQQIATLEEMLPHLRPGGVFICEDIHGIGDGFTAYCHALIDSLNADAPHVRQAEYRVHIDRLSGAHPIDHVLSVCSSDREGRSTDADSQRATPWHRMAAVFIG